MHPLKHNLNLLSELQNLEAKFKQVLEISEEGIISCNEDYKIILFNKGAENIFGYTHEEIIGKDLNVLLPENFRSSHYEHMKAFANSGKQSKPMNDRSVIVGLKKSNEKFIGRASISVIKIGGKTIFTVFIRDVSIEEQYRKELEYSEEKLSRIIEIAEDAIIIIDKEHNIKLFNKGAEKIFGYSKNEIFGKDVNTLIPIASHANHTEKISEFGRNVNSSKMMAERSEVVGVRRDGIEFHAEASISNIRIKGSIYYTAIVRDISITKLVIRKLQENVVELEGLLEDKDRYFSVLAHDLRNPFAGLKGYIDLLKSDFDNFSKEEIFEMLESIEVITNKTYLLLENLLDWSRIQLNRTNYSPKNFTLKEVVKNEVELFHEQAKFKKVNLVFYVEDSCSVFADVNMISAIIRNLISNALKFSKENGYISINSKIVNSYAEVSVTDNGIGMSKDVLKKLFLTESSKIQKGTNNEKGHGFGLLLVKEFVHKNGGTIEINSELNLGTTIKFTIPIDFVEWFCI